MGPFVNIPGENPETKAADSAHDDAYKKVIKTLDSLNLQWAHSYSWPDGSMYIFVRSVESRSQLFQRINDALPLTIHVGGVTLQSPGSNPYKAHHKTLKSYFESKHDKEPTK